MPSSDIPEDELAHFLIQVRMLVHKDYASVPEYERLMKKLRSLSNKMFRDYVGYTARGRYRIKKKGERCFAESVAATGGADAAVSKLALENPVIRKILRGESQSPSPAPPEAAPPPVPAGPGPDPEDFDPQGFGPVWVDLEALAEDDEAKDLEIEPLDPAGS